jgi:hypothetical protein
MQDQDTMVCDHVFQGRRLGAEQPICQYAEFRDQSRGAESWYALETVSRVESDGEGTNEERGMRSSSETLPHH